MIHRQLKQRTTQLFSGNGIGDLMARRLFPKILITLGLFYVAGIEVHRLNILSVEFEIVLLGILLLICAFLLTLDAANTLNKIGHRKQETEVEDIKRNRNLEVLIAKSNQELRAIFDSALVSIIGTDKNGVITHFNKGAEILLGYPITEVKGKQTPEIIHLKEEVIARGNELSEKFGREVRGFDVFVEFAKQGKYESREWTYIRKDGSRFPVQLVVTAILDGSKNITGYLGIATDVSDLNKARLDLEILANHLQRQTNILLNFAHITSHNLRSPVSNLNSLLHLYKVSNCSGDKEVLFGKFEIVTRHLTTTLNELIEALKIQKDLSKEREIVRFEEILNKTKETLAGHIIEAKAIVTFDFTRADMIEYPRSYLESIMLNLFSNAIKYKSPARVPNIHFKTETVSNEVTLIVSDNGLGINLEKHGNKLFGLHKTFHRHAEARGIGLFITKTQVEAMGGSISVESAVDNGSTFKVLFNRNN